MLSIRPACLQVHTSNRFLQGMLAVLAGCTLWLGPLAMLKLYVLPYWINVMWLDIVTYLHHHGSHDREEKLPWYRGQASCLLCPACLPLCCLPVFCLLHLATRCLGQ